MSAIRGLHHKSSNLFLIEQMGYLVPEIEMNEICVEQGFALSNMEPIGPEKSEQEW